MTEYQYGVGFWIGALVYSLINMVMNLSQIPQHNVLNYNYIISVAAFIGLVINIVMLIKNMNKKDKNEN